MPNIVHGWGGRDEICVLYKSLFLTICIFIRIIRLYFIIRQLALLLVSVTILISFIGVYINILIQLFPFRLSDDAYAKRPQGTLVFYEYDKLTKAS